MLYKGVNQLNSSEMNFVTPQSDFDSIISSCITERDQSSPCVNITTAHTSCSKTFKINGTLGCNYKCSFITQKMNHTEVASGIFNISLCNFLSN